MQAQPTSPGQAGRGSVCILATRVLAEDRTENPPSAGDPIADRERPKYFKFEGGTKSLFGRFDGAQGLHVTGDQIGIGNWKKTWMGKRRLGEPRKMMKFTNWTKRVIGVSRETRVAHTSEGCD